MKSLLDMALVVGVLCLAAAQASQFSISNVFGNGMTLQAGDPGAVIWGWADHGAVVSVYQRSFNNSAGSWGKPALASTSTANGTGGLWISQLPPTPAGAVYRLEFYATTAAGVSIANSTLDWLWFGDVYLFSGQSNMGIQVSGSRGPHNESAWAMEQYLDVYYGLRTLMVTPMNVALSPQASLPPQAFQGGWLPMNNITSVGFSAVAAYTSSGLQDLVGPLVNNSMGAIQACWGGTSINIWLSAAGVAKCPTTFPQVCGESRGAAIECTGT